MGHEHYFQITWTIFCAHTSQCHTHTKIHTHVNTCVAAWSVVSFGVQHMRRSLCLGLIRAHFCGLRSRWRWWWGCGRMASLWTMRSFAATPYQRIKTSWMPSKGGEWQVYQVQFHNLKAQNDNYMLSSGRVVDWYQWLNDYLDKCFDFWLLMALLLAWNELICASHTVGQLKMEESATRDGQILQHILFSSRLKANDRAALLLLLLSFIAVLYFITRCFCWLLVVLTRCVLCLWQTDVTSVKSVIHSHYFWS